MGDRVAAAIAFVAAAALFALGIMLGSVDSGNGAPATLLQIASTVAEVGVLVVILYAFTTIGAAPWAEVGRGLIIVAITLLMAGDSTQIDAARTFGNGVLYLTLLLLGAMMWETHARLASFAILNGLLGFGFLAFADRLGLPGDLNFMLIVVWLVALGVEWLRAPSGVAAGSDLGISAAEG